MANIVLEKNKVNNLVVTINERVTLSDPFFLIRLISKFNSNKERLFYVENISNNKIRYDEFSVEEKQNPDYSSGEVDLFTGEWKYIIYESKFNDFNLDKVSNILETGLLIVISEEYR